METLLHVFALCVLLLISSEGLKLSPKLSTKSYLGVYHTHKWSEEENRLLLYIRSRYIDAASGRIKRGSWPLVVRELNKKINANIEIYAAQHQVDNLLRRHKQKQLQQSTADTEQRRSGSNWTLAYDQQLMSIRNAYLDESGTRVKKGSWASIVSQANTVFPFTVTHSQCEKRIKDLLRKAEKMAILENSVREKIESEKWSMSMRGSISGTYQGAKASSRISYKYPTRGWNSSTAIYATAISSVEERAQTSSDIQEEEKESEIISITAHSISRASGSLYRPWTVEDSTALIALVERMDDEMQFTHIESRVYDDTVQRVLGSIGGVDRASTAGKSKSKGSSGRGSRTASKPRGYWVAIGKALGRCSIQCANRYRWLSKINEPMFLIEGEEDDDDYSDYDDDYDEDEE